MRDFLSTDRFWSQGSSSSSINFSLLQYLYIIMLFTSNRVILKVMTFSHTSRQFQLVRRPKNRYVQPVTKKLSKAYKMYEVYPNF